MVDDVSGGLDMASSTAGGTMWCRPVHSPNVASLLARWLCDGNEWVTTCNWEHCVAAHSAAFGLSGREPVVVLWLMLQPTIWCGCYFQ